MYLLTVAFTACVGGHILVGSCCAIHISVIFLSYINIESNICARKQKASWKVGQKHKHMLITPAKELGEDVVVERTV